MLNIKSLAQSFTLAGLVLVTLTACDGVSYVQTESPANAFKDYKEQGSAVIGVGEPISKRQMRANATLRVEGKHTLGDLMERVANTYNVAVRYGAGVRKEMAQDLIIADLKFNEARSYIEDVYDVQIVREGERRLLVLPAADVARIAEFAPGNNVTLVEAVRGLAKQCGMNLVITENRNRLANTRVTANMKEVTCTDAFEAILAPHGMTLVDKGDYFSIGGLPTRSWHLNLFEPLRTETQSVSYNAALEGESSSGDSGSNTVGGSSDVVVRQERDLMSELEGDLQELLTQTCNNANDASAGGLGSTTGLLSPPGADGSASTAAAPTTPCGYVRVNRSVGVVQVQAPRDVLDAADALIKRTEEIASRRLYVEARVLAVSKTRTFEQGANIGGTIRTGDNQNIALGFEGAAPPIGSPSDSIASLLSRVADQGGFLGVRDNSIQGLVRFIESFTTSYQLMKPALEVMDRQKSVLIDGRNDVFFVRESEVIASDGGNIVNTTAEERYQFEGIQFSITAQIADGDEPHTVAIQIPIIEIIGQDQLVQTFDGEQFTDDIPIVNTRVIDQKVRIRDNEVKVIGGLTRTMAVDSESGVPLLRGLPVLGKAVNEENITYEDVEFVVLLQVHRVR